MSIYAVYDKELQKMVLRTGDKLLAVLDAKEANNFKKEYENALLLLQMDHQIEQNDYAQIIMEDLDIWLELPSDYTEDETEDEQNEPWYKGLVFNSNIIGINIEVRWMTRLNRMEDSVELITKDGSYRSLHIHDNLRRNFTEKQVAFGQASSRQIRRCFDENVLQCIKEHPDFVVKFCDVVVPRDYLFSDEKEMFFDFERSIDT